MLPVEKIGNDLAKTVQYAKRNGIVRAYYAAKERLLSRVNDPYTYVPPSKEIRDVQRKDYERLKNGEEPEEVFRFATRAARAPKISIIVPTLDPQKKHFRALVESVLNQTYGDFELIIADAGKTMNVMQVLEHYRDARIVYRHLAKNAGISANTNLASAYATGDYVAFLDHDDLLTPDALYENALAILKTDAEILYSDEDKCDSAGKIYFEPNRKPDFNPDFLFANNYICHFMVMKRSLFRALQLRSEYDGAQDYDLILRAPKSEIVHIPKVLYHWRTHKESTAGNPASKSYAYEAGKNALQDYFKTCGIKTDVEHARHRGFYRVTYHPDIFQCRPEVGVLGGRILNGKHRVIGGRIEEDGTTLFAGKHELESGEMHRADTRQDVYAVDGRLMQVNNALKPLYEEVFGTTPEKQTAEPGADLKQKSIDFCRKAAEMGYLIVWDPEWTIILRDK